MTDVLVNLEQVQKTETLEDSTGGQLPIYLLIVVGQTFSRTEKATILDRINSSLVSIGDSLTALKEDLNIAVQSQFDSIKCDQENRIVFNNETTLQLDILINSTGKTLRNAFRTFLQSNSKNKHFISATLDLNSNGDFNLQDSLFSYDNLNALLNEPEAKKFLLNTENSIKFHLNSKLLELNKHWKSLEKQHKNIHLIDSQQTTQHQQTQYSEFLAGLDKLLNEAPIDSLMETGKINGSLKINKPLLYIFPSREGDAAYFTLNGYSILINGGYDRVKPCFWGFVNMLSQIDSILITHPDSDALGGLGSFFAKKLVDPETKPNVLTVLGNLIASSDYTSSSDHAQLAANLIATEAGSSIKSTSYVDLIIDSIERLKITLMPLTKSSDQPIAKHNGTLNNFSKYEHINLYSKLGQGSLDLYVLAPFANSADYREFVQQQQSHLTKHQTHQKSQLNPGQLFKNIPMSHITSAVVLLVWMPHVTKQTVLDGGNNALRLLFTGNAPQHVVISALDKVKDFEVLASPVYKIKPAPETVHTHSAKKTSVATSKPANGATKPVVNASKATASKSNMATKPPVSAKASKLENGSADAKAKPKSAPVSKAVVSKTSTEKVEKKVLSTPSTGAKKQDTSAVAKKTETTPAKKTDSAVKKVDSAKKSESTKTSTSRTSTSSTATAASATKPAGRLSSSVPKAPAKKSLTTNKSSTKLNPDATEEEKKQSRIITKRDPKPSASKPAVAKTTNKVEKTSVQQNVVAASTDSVAVSVENSMDLIASSIDASIEVKPVENVAEVVEPAADVVVENQKDFKRISSEVQSGDQSSTEWPNLSPVKRDQASILNNNTLDGHYMEDRNNSIDTNNTSGIDADTEGKERKELNFLISDAKDLIQTPEEETSPSFDTLANGDVMTRSFIDDGGVNSNPFVASSLADPKKTRANDSINDLNKTHELSDTEGDNTEDNQDLDELTKTSEIKNSNSTVDEHMFEQDTIDEAVTEQKNVPESEAIPEAIKEHEDVHETIPEAVQEAVKEQEDVDEIVPEPEVVHEAVKEQEDDVEIVPEAVQEAVKEQEDVDEIVSEPEAVHEAVKEQEDVDETVPEPEVVHEAVKEQEDVDEIVPEPEVVHEAIKDQEDDYEIVPKSESNTQSVTENLTNPDLVGEVLRPSDEPADLKETKSIAIDDLLNGLNSLSIDAVTNGHQNGIANGNHSLEDGEIVEDHEQVIMKPSYQEPISSAVTQPEDPTKWNLLELPKPVNPNDLPVPIEKNTQNGKKLASPSQEKSKLNVSRTSGKPSHVHPVYVEVSYIPAHGDSAYVDIDFFRKVRARHYVLSTEEPTEKLLNSIIEAKETWEENSLQTTIIPTYESEVLRKWYINNEEKLARLNIDITPAASMSTLTMDENPELTCQLYKHEF